MLARRGGKPHDGDDDRIVTRRWCLCAVCVYSIGDAIGEKRKYSGEKTRKEFSLQKTFSFRSSSATRRGREGEGATKFFRFRNQHCLFCAHFISPPLLFFLISSNLVGREFLNAHTLKGLLIHRVRAGTENTRFENIITRRAERNKKKTRRFKNETKKNTKIREFQLKLKEKKCLKISFFSDLSQNRKKAKIFLGTHTTTSSCDIFAASNWCPLAEDIF